MESYTADKMIDGVKAIEVLDMLSHFTENIPENPTNAQLQIAMGLLKGGIDAAAEMLRDEILYDADAQEGENQ